MKYYTLFVIFEKAAKFTIFPLLQIIGGALRVNYNSFLPLFLSSLWSSDNISGSLPDLKNNVFPIFSRTVLTAGIQNKTIFNMIRLQSFLEVSGQM